MSIKVTSSPRDRFFKSAHREGMFRHGKRDAVLRYAHRVTRKLLFRGTPGNLGAVPIVFGELFPGIAPVVCGVERHVIRLVIVLGIQIRQGEEKRLGRVGIAALHQLAAYDQIQSRLETSLI